MMEKLTDPKSISETSTNNTTTVSSQAASSGSTTDTNTDSHQILTFDLTDNVNESSLPSLEKPALPVFTSEIAAFLARPVQLASFTSTWAMWDTVDLMMRTEWLKKLSRFKYLKCDIVFEFKPVNSPFIFGLVGYTYAYQFETNTISRAQTWNTTNGMTPETMATRNVVYQDLGNNQTVRLRIPFASPFGAYDVGVNAYDSLTARQSWPVVLGTDFTTVTNAMSGDAIPKNVIVHAWLENVSLYGPTYVPQYTPESKNENLKVPTTRAGALSGAMSFGANLLEKTSGLVAALGYSKPHVQPRPAIGFPSNTTFQQEDTFFKLGLDNNCQLDPNEVDKVDEINPMSFDAFTKREGLVSRGVMNPNSRRIIPVCPGLYIANSGAIYQTPIGFLATAFEFWRGTLHYRIKVVASKYHRGAIRVSWVPPMNTPNPPTLEVAETLQNVFVDITSETEIHFDVGWGVNQPYLKFVQKSNGVAHETNEFPWANGCLVIDTFNIFAPTDASFIKVLVFVSGGDDFEVAVPTMNALRNTVRDQPSPGDNIRDLFRSNDQNRNSQVGSFGVDLYPEYPPQNRMVQEADVTSLAHTTRFVANGDAPKGDFAKRYFGERITMLSQLLKRHQLGGTYPLIVPDMSTNPYGITIPAYPFEWGSTWYRRSAGLTATSPPVQPTFIRWFASCFRGYRGEMRSNFIVRAVNAPTDIPSDRHNETKISVSRSYTDPFRKWKVLGNYYSPQWGPTGGTGVEMAMVDRGQPAQFSMPWQVPFNWLPAQNENWNTRIQPVYVVGLQDKGQGLLMFDFTYATGDDFSFVQWLGIPVMYNDDTVGGSTAWEGNLYILPPQTGP